jgi:HK97 gp10 family phage protein
MEFDRRPIRKEVLAALSQVPEVAQQTRETAKLIRDDARALAPVRTGNLRRNIRYERVYDRATGRVSYVVGWDPRAWYGWLVERGSEHAAPHPHLVPAAIKHGGTSPDNSDRAAGEA